MVYEACVVGKETAAGRAGDNLGLRVGAHVFSDLVPALDHCLASWTQHNTCEHTQNVRLLSIGMSQRETGLELKKKREREGGGKRHF